MKQESFGAETPEKRDTNREGGDIHAVIGSFVEKNLHLLEKLQHMQRTLLGKEEMNKTERDTRVAQLESHIQGIEAQNKAFQYLEQRFEAVKGDFKNFHRAARELLKEI